MKKYITGVVLMVFGVLAGLCVLLCTERIPAGYVGVVYSMNGGIQDEVLTQGWHIVSPTKKVTRYSVATEQLYMSADSREGSEGNESFDVTCLDGKMNVDFEMSYSFNADKVNEVFTKYRGMSGQDVIDSIVRGKIKTKVSEVTSQYTVLEAYMEKKAQLNKDITIALQDYLDEFGVTVESANITAARVDAQIEQAITERSKVAQELEIEKQRQEKARLEAETKVIEAQGEAEKVRIEAEAEANKNKEIAGSLTPELLEKMEMEARLKHGWVTIQGSNVITNATEE